VNRSRLRLVWEAWRNCFPSIGKTESAASFARDSGSLLNNVPQGVGHCFSWKGMVSFRAARRQKGAVMWRYEVSNNQIQDIHAAHGINGVVAVADTCVAALRRDKGKSKRLHGSRLTGLTCTSRSEAQMSSMQDSALRPESIRPQASVLGDSFQPWRELPAPAWASLIVRDAISC
jgi:hypothetical protein